MESLKINKNKKKRIEQSFIVVEQWQLCAVPLQDKLGLPDPRGAEVAVSLRPRSPRIGYLKGLAAADPDASGDARARQSTARRSSGYVARREEPSPRRVVLEGGPQAWDLFLDHPQGVELLPVAVQEGVERGRAVSPAGRPVHVEEAQVLLHVRAAQAPRQQVSGVGRALDLEEL